MKCSKCGNGISEHAKFCRVCGSSVDSMSEKAIKRDFAENKVLEDLFEEIRNMVGKKTDNGIKDLQQELEKCRTIIEKLKSENEMMKKELEGKQHIGESKCKNCKSIFQEEDQFCTKCGTKR